MRLIGVLLLGISVIVSGFIITYRLILKSKQLKKIIVLINSAEQSISYKKEPVYMIIEGFSKDNSYDFIFSGKCGSDVFFYKEVCFENRMLVINDEERKTLFDFFCGLGKTDLSGQKKHCKIYKEFFESFLVKNDEENGKKIKLYPSLFVLLGMFVILILF